MKQRYAILFFFSFFISCVSDIRAQGIYQFWGITDFGGYDDQGTLFSTRFDGTGLRSRQPFKVITPGINPKNHSPALYNNKMYGVMPDGPLQNMDFIYEYNPANNQLIRRVNIAKELNISILYKGDASFTFALLNNKFYGVARRSGANEEGCLFEYNPINHQVKKLYDFTAATGNFPSAQLTVFNNKLYGVTAEGGSFNDGVLYEFDPATSTYSKKVDFNESINGSYPSAGLTVFDGKLFGTTATGTGAVTGGTIFWFDPNNNTFSKRANMNSIGASSSYSEMTVLNNKLYGVTTGGGANSKGVLFEFDHTTTTLTKKYDFSETGSHGSATMIVYNNKLYGCNNSGAANDYGSIFEYNPATNIFTPRVILSANAGGWGTGYLTLYNNRLYGFAQGRGAFDRGAFFEYNPSINGFTKKLDLSESATGFTPAGHLNYYQRKFYGTTCYGGEYGLGSIYSYDPFTEQYQLLHSFKKEEGEPGSTGGMVLYNNKFYGVLSGGGTNQDGVLYEFDPATNVYTVKVNFNMPGGAGPMGRLSVIGSKLYGTTYRGGTNDKGSIFEFDVATNTYIPRYYFPTGYGYPMSGMTLYGGKFWGTASDGGTYSRGIIYSWTPGTNSVTVEHEFKEPDGMYPHGGLIVLNNELWGLTYNDGTNIGNYFGTLYSLNPVSHTLTTHHNFLRSTTGAWPLGTLASYNGKIYGYATLGGVNEIGGTLFEYDPAKSLLTKKVDFTGPNGRHPRYAQLITAPALVAPGHAGVCWNASEVVTVNNTNNNQWIPFTDSEGQAIAEINPNGNNLGNVSVQFYTHNGATRKDPAGRAYLDRNITITVSNQPSSPVSVRLYIRKTELDKLVNTPGSGVNGLTNLSIFKSSDACTNEVVKTAEKIGATATGWENDYVFTTTVNSFSTFYFASSSFAALPISLESFSGTVKPNGNLLTWKASCTGNATFTLERSSDGIQFNPIGSVKAEQQDCNHPFQLNDPDLSPATFYYRLKMEEEGSNASYSKIVMLNRGGAKLLQLTVAPNPVTGNIVILKTNSNAAKQVLVMIHDVAGRKLFQQNIQVPAGVGTLPLYTGNLGAGLYILQYEDGEQSVPVRLIKR